MNIAMKPVGFVAGNRREVVDDFWGGDEASITLTNEFSAEALRGLEQFSHVEVFFLLDQVDAAGILKEARHPRNNPAWPEVGIFAQRTKNRPNRLGSTTCRVLRVEGKTLYVAELDALDGTPVLDLKPVLAEFLPREQVKQPAWSHELMREYWARKR